MRWLLVRLRELLYAHPRVDSKPARVRFAGFGPSPLTVEVFAYIRTADYEEYIAVREDLYLHIMDAVVDRRRDGALPAHPDDYGGAEGIDPERARPPPPRSSAGGSRTRSRCRSSRPSG